MSESKHTPGPWDALPAAGLRRKFEVRSGTFGKFERGSPITGWGRVAQSEDDARLIAAACTSYDRHCGNYAVECAEEDLLGLAIEALNQILQDLPERRDWLNPIDEASARYVLAKVGRE